MAEQSPFEEERELEDEADEILLMLLALAFLNSSETIKVTSFTRSNFQAVQDAFRKNASKALADLYSISQRASDIALEKRVPLKGLTVDLSDPRFQQYITRVFEDNLGYLLDTNEQTWVRLQEIAADRGWSEGQLARNLKRFYGLTPNYVQTVLALEDALKAEGVSNKKIQERVSKRIDELIEWRINLSSALVGTEVVEGSKDLTFTILGETDQLNRDEYIKQWVSVTDSDTTQVCLDAHLTTAEIGGTFPNGLSSPPNILKIHPCRSSMRIIRRA